jgi:hypothetical protein
VKGLSLRQPWAWAVVHAGKTIENRRWNTSFRGLRTARGTVWGAYNAVTAYLTHERGKDQERRLDESWHAYPVDTPNAERNVTNESQ